MAQLKLLRLNKNSLRLDLQVPVHSTERAGTFVGMSCMFACRGCVMRLGISGMKVPFPASCAPVFHYLCQRAGLPVTKTLDLRWNNIWT